MKPNACAAKDTHGTLVSPEREGFASKNHRLVASLSSAGILIDTHLGFDNLPVWMTPLSDGSKILPLTLAFALLSQDVLSEARLSTLSASFVGIPSVNNPASSLWPSLLHLAKAMTAFLANARVVFSLAISLRICLPSSE